MTGRRHTSDGGSRREATGERGARAGERRGQSEVLSVVLLLAITITGTGLIVAFGSSALSDSQQNSEIDSAEHAMTQLDSKASLVGVGESPSQRVSLGIDGAVTVKDDTGWMRVRVVNRTDDTVEHDVMNQSLGEMRYRNGDTAIAYQGGGVWRKTGDGSTMVSPPEVHYRGTTLTLPLVVVDGDDAVGDRVRVSQNGSVEAKYPTDEKSGFRNPLTSGKVNVTVESEYYEAWGRFFEQRTGGTVTYHHDRDRVTITLVIPTRARSVTNALAGTTSDGMTIKGSGGSSFTDSYNSSDGAYPGSPEKPYNGTIVTKGDVTLTGGAEIYGDLQTGGGTVKLGGGETIHGNLSYGGTVNCKGNDCKSVTGWTANNGTAPDISPIGDEVDARISEYSDPSNNDNDEVDAIDEDTNTWDDADTLTLPDGTYYVSEDIDTSETDTLKLDNEDGEVILVVDDDVNWNELDVEVADPDGGTVKMYVGGSKFHVYGGSVGDTDTHRSPSLRVYSGPGLDVRLDDHAKVVGLIYAPGTDTNSGSITVHTHAELFGGVVGGGEVLMQAGGSVHFDQALASVDPVADAPKGTPQLTYLHISVSRVNVTSV